MIAEKIIKLNEGYKDHVYKCPAGYNTFGYGTNLDACTVSVEDIERIQRNDDAAVKELASSLLYSSVTKIDESLNREYSFFSDLGEVQRAVLVDLAYNVGLAGIGKFKKMLTALDARDFGIAAEEMLDSNYHAQMIKYAYPAETEGLSRVATIEFYTSLHKRKQLRSMSNALSLQYDRLEGKYIRLRSVKSTDDYIDFNINNYK